MKGRILILSDGKPGHLNQSVAFARLLGFDYQIRTVRFRSRGAKALSYLADRLGLQVAALFRCDGDLPECCAVVSAGSETYYANRLIACRLGVPSVAIMLPRGYRYGAFDLIVAQQHDRPPVRPNVLSLLVNLCHVEPQGLVKRSGNAPCVSVIIGGPSRHFRMEAGAIRAQLERIFSLFPGADFLATTSRRTPPEVEALVEGLPFRYRTIYSREPLNPIPDFLAISDYVFVTEDSTSMISEAVSFGRAAVEVLPLPGTGERNKIGRMVGELAAEARLHVFDGTLGDCRRKLDLRSMLEGVRLCA